MKFFKGKAAKWLAGVLVTSALVYIGVPAPVATQVGNVAAEQVEEMMAE